MTPLPLFKKNSKSHLISTARTTHDKLPLIKGMVPLYWRIKFVSRNCQKKMGNISVISRLFTLSAKSGLKLTTGLRGGGRASISLNLAGYNTAFAQICQFSTFALLASQYTCIVIASTLGSKLWLLWKYISWKQLVYQQRWKNTDRPERQ